MLKTYSHEIIISTFLASVRSPDDVCVSAFTPTPHTDTKWFEVLKCFGSETGDI